MPSIDHHMLVAAAPLRTEQQTDKISAFLHLKRRAASHAAGGGGGGGETVPSSRPALLRNERRALDGDHSVAAKLHPWGPNPQHPSARPARRVLFPNILNIKIVNKVREESEGPARPAVGQLTYTTRHDG